MCDTLLQIHDIFLRQSLSEITTNHIPGTDRNDMLKKQVLRHIETSLGHGNVDKVTVLTFKRFLQVFKWIMETKLEENQSKVECRRFVFKKFDQLQQKKKKRKSIGNLATKRTLTKIIPVKLNF